MIKIIWGLSTRAIVITLLAFSLGMATARTAPAASVADPVPLLDGGIKAKILYSIPWMQATLTIATCFACTSTEKSGKTVDDKWAVEIFPDNGTPGDVENDVTIGEGVSDIDFPGDTDIKCTLGAASIADELTISTDAEACDGCKARIVSSTKKLICTAFMVPVTGDPPGFMTILPMYKKTKQKGEM